MKSVEWLPDVMNHCTGDSQVCTVHVSEQEVIAKGVVIFFFRAISWHLPEETKQSIRIIGVCPGIGDGWMLMG
jgi:hypothetical protein